LQQAARCLANWKYPDKQNLKDSEYQLIIVVSP